MVQIMEILRVVFLSQEVNNMDNKLSIKKLARSWHLWIMIAIIFAAIIIGRNNGIPILLPLALVLVCPIMMLFMMGAHKKH